MSGCLDGEEPHFSVERWHVARRANHICCECREPIAIGQRYQRIAGVWDKRWETYKTCADCYETRETARDLAGFTPVFGQAACCFVQAMREADR